MDTGTSLIVGPQVDILNSAVGTPYGQVNTDGDMKQHFFCQIPYFFYLYSFINVMVHYNGAMPMILSS